MQQLHCNEKDNERQPATIADSERHAETPWYRKRKGKTCRNYMGPERQCEKARNNRRQ